METTVVKKDLTFEEVDQLLSYDAETGLLTWKVAKANHVKVGDVTGCPDRNGHLRVVLNRKIYMVHRIAWLLSKGYWPNQQIDHIDGNTANNRLDNLRECTQAQNMQNLGKRSDNKSGIQGISWYKRYQKWRAYICVNGDIQHLGYYESIEEAAAARAEAKALHHTFQPFDRQ
ncbi:HNH endonuclease family protein [Xanthomonas phage OP1]|uniref:HNH endonuclease family protein n=1 Tax=Xanthomonas phage OP1 TaxID=2994040 RepID=Q2NPD3_9CAUD|nr:HNH endonuclease [Xanthomonas phage OP1]BAE72763.1 HNH endonuclease family protein [Xanthomonas phage OP1]